jgi:hypothetical protein
MSNENPRAELAQLVVPVLEAVRVVQEGTDFRPAPGSRARAEMDASDSELGGSGDDNPSSTALSIGVLHLAGGLDHLWGAVAMLREPRTVVSLLTLVRAALESFGRAAWIFDSEVDGRNRVARGLNELLYGMRANTKIGPPLADPDSIEQRIAETVAAAQERGFKLLPQKDSRVAPEFEERRPGATAVISRLFENFVDPEFGGTLFRILAASAHGTPPGLTTYFREERESLDPRHTVGTLYLEPVLASSMLAFSVWGLHEALSRQVALYGWKNGWNEYVHLFTPTLLELATRAQSE